MPAVHVCKAPPLCPTHPPFGRFGLGKAHEELKTRRTLRAQEDMEVEDVVEGEEEEEGRGSKLEAFMKDFDPTQWWFR